MAEFNSVDTLSGFFKVVYSSDLENLIPEGVKLSKMIPFVKPNQRLGAEYRQPVTLQLEHGVSYGGSAGLAFTLNSAIAGTTQEASVKSCEMVLRGRVAISAISRSINDAASFGRATKHVIKNLMVSSYKKQEQMMFYGQKGLAIVDGVVSASTTVPLRVESFAPGIFAGAEGMRINIKTGTSASDAAADVSIVKVDIKNKSLELSAAVTLADGDTIYEFGAYGNECLGLEAMLDGSVAAPFGITSASYSLWEGNTYSAGSAALSLKKIGIAVADAIGKGLDGKLDAFVNPSTWADLIDEQNSTLRQVDSSFDVKKFENGSESIVLHSQNGIIEVHSSTYVKEGIAFLLELKSFERVGSSELTFKLPGTNEDYMIKLQDAHGIEFRTYCDTALFCNALGHNIIIQDIVNS